LERYNITHWAEGVKKFSEEEEVYVSKKEGVAYDIRRIVPERNAVVAGEALMVNLAAAASKLSIEEDHSKLHSLHTLLCSILYEDVPTLP